MDRRGQAHTLEAVVTSMLLLTSLVFALQVTAVTPLSASTSSQHIENQQQATAEGLLEIASREGALKPALLYGNDSADGRDDGRFGFHETSGEAFYTNDPPTNRFGALLDRTFGGEGLAYNVFVVYQTAGGDTARLRMVYQGEPSDNAVVATTLVTLYDGDVLHEPEADGDSTDVARPTGTTLAGAGDEFYALDANPDSPVFNVVRVEVVVWRQ
ncbi:DUF7288 family protein [Halomarina litorea]|uniref:DUF7288 family protein n=1 Tax=Halomarina litorea TaxID=2961595 RepID=UPI0020C2CFCF|nr:hypothetical protein [Halomarina sp. BCD28]